MSNTPFPTDTLLSDPGTADLSPSQPPSAGTDMPGLRAGEPITYNHPDGGTQPGTIQAVLNYQSGLADLVVFGGVNQPVAWKGEVPYSADGATPGSWSWRKAAPGGALA